MCLISVPNLLKLDRFLPHQDLLREGLLVLWDESMRGRTIFVSHQVIMRYEIDVCVVTTNRRAIAINLPPPSCL